MGATKKTQFSSDQINLSTIARAIASPARIAILQHLNDNHFASNKEFTTLLKLSKTAVFQHLQMLKEANLVNETYLDDKHGYYIENNAKYTLDKVNCILN
jgi:DNA-binding transcriptional ArsR family regulator